MTGVPYLDADGGPDDHHFAARLDAEKFAKAFWDDQSSPSGQLYLPVTGRQEPTQPLHFLDAALEPAGTHFALDQFDPYVELCLPESNAPQAQAAKSLLGQDAIGRFAQKRLGHLGRNRQPVPLVERSRGLSKNEISGIGHRSA